MYGIISGTVVRIVDLDGTISDDSWRLWLIDPQLPDSTEKYHNYHIHCDGDTVMNRHIVDDSPVPVFIMTARPEYLRQKTHTWLVTHRLRYKAMFMRPIENHVESVKLKEGWVKQLYFNWMFNFENGYDDRADIVEMFNANGIKGVQVQ
jgi:uncharacterized HAD superfamily protein